MRCNKGRISRVLIPFGAAVALYLVSAVGIPAAGAHVHASSDNPVRGAMAVVTFQVPNESNTGAATTALTVSLPNVASASTESIPGWTAKLDRDTASGTVRSVTWTAAPNGGIGVDQFAVFRISLQLPDTDTVSFPATQTYSDGAVVKWDQPPLPSGGEPEHPVPTLTLSAEQQPQRPAARTADDTALWVAIAGAVIGAAGLVLGLLNWRRRTS